MPHLTAPDTISHLGTVNISVAFITRSESQWVFQNAQIASGCKKKCVGLCFCSIELKWIIQFLNFLMTCSFTFILLYCVSKAIIMFGLTQHWLFIHVYLFMYSHYLHQVQMCTSTNSVLLRIEVAVSFFDLHFAKRPGVTLGAGRFYFWPTFLVRSDLYNFRGHDILTAGQAVERAHGFDWCLHNHHIH